MRVERNALEKERLGLPQRKVSQLQESVCHVSRAGVPRFEGFGAFGEFKAFEREQLAVSGQ